MNDDTVRRQSRRETEPAARELAPPVATLFFIKETRRRCFSVLPVSQLSIRYSVAGGTCPSPTTATVKFYNKKPPVRKPRLGI